MMDKDNIISMLCGIGFLLICVIVFSVLYHDKNMSEINQSLDWDCAYIKEQIQSQEGLIIKKGYYESAVERWNSDECKHVREP